MDTWNSQILRLYILRPWRQPATVWTPLDCFTRSLFDSAYKKEGVVRSWYFSCSVSRATLVRRRAQRSCGIYYDRGPAIKTQAAKKKTLGMQLTQSDTIHE